MSIHVDKELSAAERRGKIEEMLRRKGQVTVLDLAGKFGVSEMTIRRDLHRMEEQGIASVHYGGASYRDKGQSGIQYEDRKDALFQEKIRIAKYAASQIMEGDVIYMDTSTTVSLMTRFLPEVHITIVTNSLAVINDIWNYSRVRLYMAPGCYEEQYGGAADYTTVEYVSQFSYDKSFFGASALDGEFGVSATKEVEAVLKQRIWKNTKDSYLLVDHTKFGKKNYMRYNMVEDYRSIITDTEADECQLELIKRRGGNQVLV